MRRNLLASGLVVLVLALCLAVSAPTLAGGGIYARGDYQVLQNDESGATIRVWVQNSTCRNGHALVTFAGKDLKGAPVQAAYAIWVPAFSARPVSISFGFPINPDPKIIVTGLGG